LRPLPTRFSAYLGPFSISHRHHTCIPQVSPRLRLERRHLDASRDSRMGRDAERPGGKWGWLTAPTSGPQPGPAPPTQKPRPPTWLGLGAASKITVAHWLGGNLGARGPAPPSSARCYLAAHLPLLQTQGEWGDSSEQRDGAARPPLLISVG
jgi:hypothetical protein